MSLYRLSTWMFCQIDSIPLVPGPKEERPNQSN